MKPRTCEWDLGTKEKPDACGQPAEWMQPSEFGDDFPSCGLHAGEDAYPIEVREARRGRAWR